MSVSTVCIFWGAKLEDRQHFRAGTRSGIDMKLAAGEIHSLSHADETKVPIAAELRSAVWHLEANSIVSHRYERGIIGHSQADQYHIGA